jgi:hypothetical protein
MSTRKGIDYAYGNGLTVATMKANGVTFACRYLSGGSGKDITKAELSNLLKGGIDVCLVWETTAGRAMSGSPGGQRDATRAKAQADGLGLKGIPVYFAVDFDASAAQQPTINGYLDGAGLVLGKNRVGLYAGYGPVKRAFDAKKIAYGWQTYAWSGGKWEIRAQLRQFHNNVPMGPTTVDLDQAISMDFGQWPRPKTTPVPPLPTPKGPVRHVSNGLLSINDVAGQQKCAVSDIVAVSLANMTPANKAKMNSYMLSHPKMPKGMVYWTPK